MTTVTIITSGKRTAVPPSGEGMPPVVPAQNLILEIQSEVIGTKVLLNDELVPAIPGPNKHTAYVLVDCFRSTGFHRLLIASEVYCFGTADAKLELEGILKILEFTGNAGLSWGRQLIFSNGIAIRDPRVDYAWIRSNGPKILELCNEISEKPATTTKTSLKLSSPRGGRVVLGETISLLRSNPRAFLEEHPRGLLNICDRRWMPRRVVNQSKAVSYDTVGNRRATRLLLDTYDLAKSVIASLNVPQQNVKWLGIFMSQVQNILDRFPFRVLVRIADRLPPNQSVQERIDSRYAAIFLMHYELIHELAWEPSRKVADRYAYVGYSDEIYQAFVAVLLGKVFGAQQVVPYLRQDLGEPCFRSDDWEIYYDTCPPTPGYSSWRDSSSRPARLTPDYCIIDRKRNRGILGDAKYRGNAGGGKLPSTALNDCQVYMQHFNLSSFVVFYPGQKQFVEEISGTGNTILEVSITPFEGIVEWLTETVRPRIEALLQPLGAKA